MGKELEDEEDTLEIDLNQWAVKGKCKAGKWKEHFKKLEEVLGIKNDILPK